MGKGNVNKICLDDIIELCRNYSKISNSSQKTNLQKFFVVVSELIEEVAKFKTNILVELNKLKGVTKKSKKEKES